MSNRHLLIVSVSGFHRHISCTSLNSNSLPLFHSLCLSDSVFVRIHPCLSRQGSLKDRSGSLSAFIVMWLCRFSMRCERCTSWTASHLSMRIKIRRPDVKSSGFSFRCSFNHNPLQWRCDFLRQLQLWSHHLPRSATQTFPVRPKHRSVSVLSSFCFAQLHFWSYTKLLLFDHDDQQRFLESCGLQKKRHRLLQFFETKPSLQIAQLAFSIFDQFSSFHSSFRLCQYSFCS